MTGCRIHKFGIFTISGLGSVCMNVKIRNKFIEIKYARLIKLEVWKQNLTSLTGLYPNYCHCQCWRITLLTAIIVIPKEGQCEDQVWLKHRTFAMLLRRSWDGTLGHIDLGPILGPSYRLENSPSDWHVDPIGSLVPAAFGHDVCLMSGYLSCVSWSVTA